MVEITGSRWKTTGYLCVALAFVAIALSELKSPDHNNLLVNFSLLFFGLCSVICGWLLIWPQRLLLDDEGYTLSGGLLKSPAKVLWREVDQFYVARHPKGWKEIHIKFKPEYYRARSRRYLGFNGSLPLGWPGSKKEMVELLEAYRMEAQEKADTDSLSA